MSERIQTVIDWTPVGERLPDAAYHGRSAPLLFVVDGAVKHGQCWLPSHGWPAIWYDVLNPQMGHVSEAVTHWAPMPTFPTGKGGV